MQIVNVEQGSPEWFEARKLKMTASHATAIGNAGKGLETYIYELCADYFSNGEVESFKNKQMERGNEFEEEARSIYGFETGLEAEKVGFVIHNDYVGCSPDGFVGDDGLIEIKCKSDAKHLKQIVLGEKEIESTYIWQIQMQMLTTGRNWCDFVSYNPNFEKPIYIHRVHADEKKHEKLLNGFKVGEEMIKNVLIEMGK
jgi:putative phage-type endonuclease